MEERIKEGTLAIRVTQSSKNKEEVGLGLQDGDCEFLHNTVDLLTVSVHHVRDLIYMYVEELVQMLPKVKEEGVGSKEVIAVFETMLLGLDYLTDPAFQNIYFEDKHSNHLDELMEDCFNIEKKHSFLTNVTRPRVNKGKIVEDGKNSYAIDTSEDKKRIFMGVLYKKPESLFEHFLNVSKMLSDLELQGETVKTPYDDILKGMRDCELHDYCIYNINRIRRVFLWFLNSYSCRENELAGFDVMEISAKLQLNRS